MLVPSTDFNNYDNCNFEHSSNRTRIKCAFRILVSKWPILWHKLDVKFERCMPLINACFYLHNFCADQKMIKEDSLISQDQHVKVQPLFKTASAVWSKQPKFDKKGRPVEYLNLIHYSEKITDLDRADIFFLRDRFAMRVEMKGLSRPLKKRKIS